MRTQPFDWVPRELQGRFLIALTVFTTICSLWLFAIGEVLKPPVAPDGIVSFELARTAVHSQAIIDSWSPEVREVAMLFAFVALIVMLLRRLSA